ncbi:Mss4-like protein [Podospora australis]|uniref:Mss4-like protein n=1 Tax=Podospora australis TaxID=1536484 RepID=A0AAN6WJP0_9PEZI|nr:Mss4-like protein [Podospora australis]
MSSDLHLPHQLPGANQTLTAQCHCKTVHFTITLPTSSLPLPAYLCHCHICRYIHGTLCIFHASLPKGVEPEFISGNPEEILTGYTHDQAASERYFCSTCGCHIGDRDLEADPETGKYPWTIATSILTPQNENTFQIRAHYFTTSTPGDGVYSWLPAIGDRKLHIPKPRQDSDKISKPEPSLPQTDDQGNEVLLAQCHCAGVSFALTRPSEEEKADPFLSRFLSPIDSSKRVACVCVCKDCRLVDGTHAIGWTFAPLSCLKPSIGSDLKYGTLKAYRSSENVTRAFCGKCGATVFYTTEDEERANTEDKRIMDIAVGILRAPEGILAEEWLTWRTGRLAGLPSGLEYDRAFTESLDKGMKEWGLKKYGEVTTFNIPRDS